MKQKKGSHPVKYDRISRYQAHIAEGLELNATEQQMLERYRRASAMLAQGFPRQQAVAALQREYEISEPQAYLIIRDSTKIYGDASQVDRAGLRHVHYELFMLTAQLARRQEDYGTMTRAVENAAKLYDLFKPDVAGIDPSKFARPASILFTDDETVLQEAKEREMRDWQGEDTDFEEVED